MPSRYGASRGEPDYDLFRTGLTFAQIRRMCRGRRDDPDHRARHHAYRRKGILGAWHQLKLEEWRELCRAQGFRTRL